MDNRLDHSFDKNWHMKPWGENGVLFTAYYLALLNYPAEWRGMAKKAIEAHRKPDGSRYSKEDPNMSHDHMTAVVWLSRAYGFSYHKNLSTVDFRTMVHTRDLIFYHLMAEKWYSKLLWLLYPICFIAQMTSCLTKYKTRKGIKLLKTDGKLLTWLRVKTFKLRITNFFCKEALVMNEEFGSFQNCFKIYFGEEHPNSTMPKEFYEV